MELLHKLEVQIADAMKGLPHLPESARKWLGANMWWLTLIGTILTGLAALMAVYAIIIVSLIGTSAMVAGSVMYAAQSSAWSFVAIISLAILLLEGVVMALAISPLKSYLKKGWDLLFAVALASAALQALSNLISMNIFALIWGLLWAAVGLWFLFEIRSQFSLAKAAKIVPAADKKE